MKANKKRKLITIGGIVVIILAVLLFIFKNQIFADVVGSDLATNYPIFPKLQEFTSNGSGKFIVNANTKFSLPDEENIRNIVSGYLKENFEGYGTISSDANSFSLSIDPSVTQQAGGYKITIFPNSVTILAKDKEGETNSLQTLFQLLRTSNNQLTLPSVKITDYPTSPVRMAYMSNYSADWVYSSNGLHGVHHEEKIAYIKTLAAIKFNKVLIQDSNYIRLAVKTSENEKKFNQFWADQKEIFDLARANNIEPIPLVQGYSHSNPWGDTLGRDVRANQFDSAEYSAASEKIYKHWFAITEQLKNYLNPTSIHIGHDEIRNINSYDSERNAEATRGKTNAELLAYEIKRVYQEAIKTNLPNAEIYIWSDMFDPNHNGSDNIWVHSENTSAALDILSNDKDIPELKSKITIMFWGVFKMNYPQCKRVLGENSIIRYYGSQVKCVQGVWRANNETVGWHNESTSYNVFADNGGNFKIPFAIEKKSGFVQKIDSRFGLGASQSSCVVGDGYNPNNTGAEKEWKCLGVEDADINEVMSVTEESIRYFLNKNFKLIVSSSTARGDGGFPSALGGLVANNGGIKGISFTSWLTGVRTQPENLNPVPYFDKEMANLPKVGEISWSGSSIFTSSQGDGFIENAKSQLINNDKKYLNISEIIYFPTTNPSPTPSPSKTATMVPSPSPTPSPSPSATAVQSATAIPFPSPPSTSSTFPKGFSTLGVTESIPSSLITTVDGLYVYQFDGTNNKWLMAPTDSFTLEPSKGYYVYNKQDAKTISLPYDTFSTNSYSLTKGWNMLHSLSAKQRSTIQLSYNNTPASIDSLIQQNKIDSKVFIVDNEQSKDSCTYFSLLSDTDQPANCAASSNKKVKTIPSGKTFWVYVK